MNSSTACDSIAPTTVNTGGLLPTNGIQSGASSTSDGNQSKSYEQSQSNYSISSGGSMSSMGVQRMTSQMIPTPGFNNNNTNPANAYAGGQNSRILQNLGSQMGSSIRSGLPQKSYGFSNGALNGGMGMIANNFQLVNEPGTSESYMTAPYASSPKPLQHFDQLQRQLMQCDGYEVSTGDYYGSGNFYGAVTSVGSVMNAQNLGPVSMQSMPKTNLTSTSNQSNLHGTQQSGHLKPQLLDQSEKMNFQSTLASRESVFLSHHQQQFQKQHNQFQQQSFVQQQRLHKQRGPQHQHPINNSASDHSQLSSDHSTQVKCESGVEHQKEVLLSQPSEQLPMYELENQFLQITVEDHSRSVQSLSLPPGQHDICPSTTQSSQQMQQILHPHQFVSESQSDFNCLPIGPQSDAVLQSQWHPQSQDNTCNPENMSQDHRVQQDFRQRISGQDEAQPNNLSSKESK